MTLDQSWTEQWHRIHRWRARVVRTRDVGCPAGLSSEDCRDEVLALFQAVWHLKDWLINDAALAATDETRVEEDWLKSAGAASLRVSADVANSSKHMKLTRKPRAQRSSQNRGDLHAFDRPGQIVTVRSSYWVQAVPRKRDVEAVALVDECLDEWKTFLDRHGIDVPDKC